MGKKGETWWRQRQKELVGGKGNAQLRRGEFSHCAVCRRNHEQGKGHRYSTSHRKALEQVLAKALDKIQQVRVFLEKPLPLRAGERAQDRFWCLFCEEDVVDTDSLFACSNAILHLANSKHVANVRKFWCEQGADVKSRHQHSFTDEELEKWEAECNLVALDAGALQEHGAENSIYSSENNIHYEQLPAENLGRNFASVSSVSVPPLPVLKDEKFQVFRHTIPGASTTANQSLRQTISAAGANLTAIRVQPLLPGEGNVHSGAAPPWLADVATHGNYEEHTKGSSRKKQRESQKLDRRVGAAWAKRRKAELERDISRDSSSDWLPSFGRVWQGGSRRESKKEFESENVLERKNGDREPAEVQPYIGKRKLLEVNSEQVK